MLVSLALAAQATQVLALPTGEQVVAGQAEVSRPNASTVVVHQGSDRAVLEWQSFGLGAAERAQFVQPNANSFLLNRVTGGAPSEIFGTIQANGRVMLVNPHGVHFMPGAQVDVGGLIASTLNIATRDFMEKHLQFTRPDGSIGTVRNDGVITAGPGGFVALIGEQVSHSGSITVPRGSIGFAAGDRVLVDFDRDGLMTFAVDVAAAAAKISLAGVTEADGGRVVLEARARSALQSSVISVDGIVRARGVSARGGEIFLDGGTSGVVGVTGTLDTSAGGSGHTGGEVRVLGNDVRLEGAARVDASGDSGGGRVFVGGDYQGGNAVLRNAARASVAGDVRIAADAIRSGDGGRVIIWSDGATAFHGGVSVRGGPLGGDGGFAETSGKRTLSSTGFVDSTAPAGRLGTWLIDPETVTMVDSGTQYTLSCAGPPNTCDPSTVTAIPKTLSSNLEVRADRTITVPAGFNVRLDGRTLTLTAGTATVAGSVVLGAQTGGTLGDITLGVTPNTANSSGTFSVSARGGSITFGGILANPHTVSLQTQALTIGDATTDGGIQGANVFATNISLSTSATGGIGTRSAPVNVHEPTANASARVTASGGSVFLTHSESGVILTGTNAATAASGVYRVTGARSSSALNATGSVSAATIEFESFASVTVAQTVGGAGATSVIVSNVGSIAGSGTIQAGAITLSAAGGIGANATPVLVAGTGVNSSTLISATGAEVFLRQASGNATLRDTNAATTNYRFTGNANDRVTGVTIEGNVTGTTLSLADLGTVTLAANRSFGGASTGNVTISNVAALAGPGRLTAGAIAIAAVGNVGDTGVPIGIAPQADDGTSTVTASGANVFLSQTSGALSLTGANSATGTYRIESASRSAPVTIGGTLTANTVVIRDMGVVTIGNGVTIGGAGTDTVSIGTVSSVGGDGGISGTTISLTANGAVGASNNAIETSARNPGQTASVSASGAGVFLRHQVGDITLSGGTSTGAYRVQGAGTTTALTVSGTVSATDLSLLDFGAITLNTPDALRGSSISASNVASIGGTGTLTGRNVTLAATGSLGETGDALRIASLTSDGTNLTASGNAVFLQHSGHVSLVGASSASGGTFRLAVTDNRASPAAPSIAAAAGSVVSATNIALSTNGRIGASDARVATTGGTNATLSAQGTNVFLSRDATDVRLTGGGPGAAGVFDLLGPAAVAQPNVVIGETFVASQVTIAQVASIQRSGSAVIEAGTVSLSASGNIGSANNARLLTSSGAGTATALTLRSSGGSVFVLHEGGHADIAGTNEAASSGRFDLQVAGNGTSKFDIRPASTPGTIAATTIVLEADGVLGRVPATGSIVPVSTRNPTGVTAANLAGRGESVYLSHNGNALLATNTGVENVATDSEGTFFLRTTGDLRIAAAGNGGAASISAPHAALVSAGALSFDTGARIGRGTATDGSVYLQTGAAQLGDLLSGSRFEPVSKLGLAAPSAALGGQSGNALDLSPFLKAAADGTIQLSLAGQSVNASVNRGALTPSPATLTVQLGDFLSREVAPGVGQSGGATSGANRADTRYALAVTGGSLTSLADSGTRHRITAAEIFLTANNGTVGTSEQALVRTASLSPTGSTRLSASAQDVFLRHEAGDLTIDDPVTATGTAGVRSSTLMLDVTGTGRRIVQGTSGSGLVTADRIVLRALGDIGADLAPVLISDSAGPDARLTANAANVFLRYANAALVLDSHTGNGVTIDNAATGGTVPPNGTGTFRVTAGGSRIDLTITGDVTAGTVLFPGLALIRGDGVLAANTIRLDASGNVGTSSSAPLLTAEFAPSTTTRLELSGASVFVGHRGSAIGIDGLTAATGDVSVAGAGGRQPTVTIAQSFSGRTITFTGIGALTVNAGLTATDSLNVTGAGAVAINAAVSAPTARITGVQSLGGNGTVSAATLDLEASGNIGSSLAQRLATRTPTGIGATQLRAVGANVFLSHGGGSVTFLAGNRAEGTYALRTLGTSGSEHITGEKLLADIIDLEAAGRIGAAGAALQSGGTKTTGAQNQISASGTSVFLARDSSAAVLEQVTATAPDGEFVLTGIGNGAPGAISVAGSVQGPAVRITGAPSIGGAGTITADRVRLDATGNVGSSATKLALRSRDAQAGTSIDATGANVYLANTGGDAIFVGTNRAAGDYVLDAREATARSIGGAKLTAGNIDLAAGGGIGSATAPLETGGIAGSANTLAANSNEVFLLRDAQPVTLGNSAAAGTFRLRGATGQAPQVTVGGLVQAATVDIAGVGSIAGGAGALRASTMALSASGAIGSQGQPLETRSSAAGASTTLSATAQDVFVRHTVGSVVLGDALTATGSTGTRSSTFLVDVAAGSIAHRIGVPSVPITADRFVLRAVGGDIGTDAAPVQVADASGPDALLTANARNVFVRFSGSRLTVADQSGISNGVTGGTGPAAGTYRIDSPTGQTVALTLGGGIAAGTIALPTLASVEGSGELSGRTISVTATGEVGGAAGALRTASPADGSRARLSVAGTRIAIAHRGDSVGLEGLSATTGDIEVGGANTAGSPGPDVEVLLPLSGRNVRFTNLDALTVSAALTASESLSVTGAGAVVIDAPVSAPTARITGAQSLGGTSTLSAAALDLEASGNIGGSLSQRLATRTPTGAGTTQLKAAGANVFLSHGGGSVVLVPGNRATGTYSLETLGTSGDENITGGMLVADVIDLRAQGVIGTGPGAGALETGGIGTAGTPANRVTATGKRIYLARDATPIVLGTVRTFAVGAVPAGEFNLSGVNGVTTGAVRIDDSIDSPTVTITNAPSISGPGIVRTGTLRLETSGDIGSTTQRLGLESLDPAGGLRLDAAGANVFLTARDSSVQLQGANRATGTYALAVQGAGSPRDITGARVTADRIDLAAPGNIGSAAAPLETAGTTGATDAILASAANLFLARSGARAVLTQLSAPAGEIRLLGLGTDRPNMVATGTITAGTLRAEHVGAVTLADVSAAQAVTIADATGAVTLGGRLETPSVSITGVDSIGGTGSIRASSIVLGAAGGIGTRASPLATQSLTAATGTQLVATANNVFLSHAGGHVELLPGNQAASDFVLATSGAGGTWNITGAKLAADRIELRASGSVGAGPGIAALDTAGIAGGTRGEIVATGKNVHLRREGGAVVLDEVAVDTTAGGSDGNFSFEGAGGSRPDVRATNALRARNATITDIGALLLTGGAEVTERLIVERATSVGLGANVRSPEVAIRAVDSIQGPGRVESNTVAFAASGDIGAEGAPLGLTGLGNAATALTVTAANARFVRTGVPLTLASVTVGGGAGLFSLAGDGAARPNVTVAGALLAGTASFANLGDFTAAAGMTASTALTLSQAGSVTLNATLDAPTVSVTNAGGITGVGLLSADSTALQATGNVGQSEAQPLRVAARTDTSSNALTASAQQVFLRLERGTLTFVDAGGLVNEAKAAGGTFWAETVGDTALQGFGPDADVSGSTHRIRAANYVFRALDANAGNVGASRAGDPRPLRIGLPTSAESRVTATGNIVNLSDASAATRFANRTNLGTVLRNEAQSSFGIDSRVNIPRSAEGLTTENGQSWIVKAPSVRLAALGGAIGGGDVFPTVSDFLWPGLGQIFLPSQALVDPGQGTFPAQTGALSLQAAQGAHLRVHGLAAQPAAGTVAVRADAGVGNGKVLVIDSPGTVRPEGPVRAGVIVVRAPAIDGAGGGYFEAQANQQTERHPLLSFLAPPNSPAGGQFGSDAAPVGFAFPGNSGAAPAAFYVERNDANGTDPVFLGLAGTPTFVRAVVLGAGTQGGAGARVVRVDGALLGAELVNAGTIETAQAIADSSQRARENANPKENAEVQLRKGVFAKAGPGRPAVEDSRGSNLPAKCDGVVRADGWVSCQ